MTHSKQAVKTPYLMVTILGIWSLGLFSFTIPGRSSNGTIDSVAIAKLTICSLLIGLACRELWISHFSRFRQVVYLYFPLIVFVAWCATSVVWSPLPTTTISRLVGIVALLTLSICIAMGSRTSKEFDLVLGHLALSLFAVNCVLLTLHLVRPDLSGLDRSLKASGADGAIHPTAAAANASLGLMLGFCMTVIRPINRTIRGFRLAWLSIPMMVVGALVLLLAASRTAQVLVVVLLPITWFTAASHRTTGRLLLAGFVGSMLTMLVDAKFELADRATENLVDAAYRGGTTSQLATLNGRTEMWAAVSSQFEKSPWIGHGFGVSSEEGTFLMWRKYRNHTAHNLVLQVLASTGLVGCVFFLWGLCKPLRFALSSQPMCKQSEQIRHMSWLLLLWYLGWSQLCVTFVGPLRTESVVFFSLLGLLVANGLADQDARRDVSEFERASI